MAKHKLPVGQLFVLAICRFAEPLVYTSVYPYLPEMIESFNVPTNAVSKWVGIMSAAFSLSQAATGIPWGRASDRFGRKPVILCASFCVLSSSLLFGFSKNLVWAVVARAIAGASNGNVSIMRTVVAELVPFKELQPKAFSIMPLVWTIGSIFGPGFGGALANPADRYPNVFGGSRFWKSNPFALPNIVASGFFLIGLLVAILFLKETLATKRNNRDHGRVLGRLLLHPFKRQTTTLPEERSSLIKHSGDGIATEHDESKVQDAPSYREVFSYQSNLNLLVYSLLALHAVAFDQLLPVFMHFPPQSDRSSNPDVQLPFKFSGGFGIDSNRIGILFTVYGIVGVLVQFFIFPPLANRFGVLICLKAVTAAFPIIYLLTPFTVLFPAGLAQQVALLVVMLFKAWASIFAFPCTTILLTNSAASLRVLGTLNGVATSISAVGRAIGPALGGWTFTVGVDSGYAILPWWTLAVFALLGAISPWWLVEMEGFGGEGNDDDNDISRSTNAESDEFDRSSLEERHDAVDGLDNLRISKTTSHSSSNRPINQLSRRMSSPIGQSENIGPGGPDRLSNGLGQTRSGLGAGGTSYH